VLQSVSRLMPDVVDRDNLKMSTYLRGVMSTYKETQDLISIGAYKRVPAKRSTKPSN
jgi:flagellar biosynthesis/type III secretory pathway ATPase